jgi:L-amino acid N-acyltransferase YncA
MQIRHADSAIDGAACAAVYAPFVEGSTISFEYTPPTGDQMADRIAQLTATHAWLVAEDDGSVVGFAYGSPHRERDAYRWSAEVSVYVSASHHRRGVGRALYGALFELLARQGFRIVLAGIALPNEGSIALHQALGFESVGVYRQIGWKAGAWWDVAWWQLELGSADGPAGEPPGAPVRLDSR